MIFVLYYYKSPAFNFLFLFFLHLLLELFVFPGPEGEHTFDFFSFFGQDLCSIFPFSIRVHQRESCFFRIVFFMSILLSYFGVDLLIVVLFAVL